MSRTSNLPVPVVPATQASCGRAGAQPKPRAQTGRAGAFDAHLLGQEGARRGLKGGPPVLDAARAAYLDAEFSGDADRRLPAGIFKVAKV